MHPGRRNKKKSKIKKVESLGDLQWKCNAEYNPDLFELYRKLAIISAKNLGCSFSNPTLEQAFQCLKINIQESEIAAQESGEQFDGEKGVTDEINFCLDLV